MAGKIITGIKDQKFLIIIIIATFLIIFGMIFLNDVVVSIRLLQLKASLRNIDKKASDMSTVGMVSKFKLYKELYKNKISEDDLVKQEYTSAYQTVNIEDYKDISVTKYKGITPPILMVMNLLRFLLQKQPIEYILKNKENYKLTLAYRKERLKDYEEALKLYDELLKPHEVDEDQIHIIQLHQGYCYSIIGEYDKAKEKYLEIIKNFKNEEVAITAARLLRYLEELEAEVLKVKESDDNPLQKSEKLYKLIAFREALEILEKVAEKGDATSDKLQYLRARCLEETGEKEEAVKIYQDIIDDFIEQENSNVDTSIQSNRRILLISTSEKEGNKIKELSEKNNELIKDPDFDVLLDTALELEAAFEEEQNKINVLQKEEIEKEEGVLSATPGKVADSTETEEQFEGFLEDSIKNVGDKIKKREEDGTKTPPSTYTSSPSPIPTIKREKRTPEPVKTPAKTQRRGPYKVEILDENGNLIKVEEFGETGSLIKVVEYNEEGMITKVETYDGVSGKMIGYLMYEFDEKGIITKVEQYDGVSGKMIGYLMYEFDEKGNPIKIYAYDQDGNEIKDD